jgi:hypothetical protein
MGEEDTVVFGVGQWLIGHGLFNSAAVAVEILQDPKIHSARVSLLFAQALSAFEPARAKRILERTIDRLLTQPDPQIACEASQLLLDLEFSTTSNVFFHEFGREELDLLMEKLEHIEFTPKMLFRFAQIYEAQGDANKAVFFYTALLERVGFCIEAFEFLAKVLNGQFGTSLM